jgi:hypothetical protein
MLGTALSDTVTDSVHVHASAVDQYREHQHPRQVRATVNHPCADGLDASDLLRPVPSRSETRARNERGLEPLVVMGVARSWAQQAGEIANSV